MFRRTMVIPVVALGLAVSACGASDDDRPDPLPPLPDVDPPAAATAAPMTNGRVDATWLTASSKATKIPRRVLLAYVTAAARANAAEPRCELAWNTVAAIGRIESVHGAVYGSRIHGDGVARPRIRGVALDGDGVRAISDTDGGDLDGDRTWDRAVGPMQFIPTTWSRWGSDGDGDGRSDPQDVDDAALATGRYLCDSGKRLGSRDGWLRAVVTYNESAEYVRKVSRTATGYADDASRA
ncbi:MAG: lytic transglycosylase domain-containing protein [Aeromicrobium sp.]